MTSARLALRALASLLVALALASCTHRPADENAGCLFNGDCADGLVCAGRVCRAVCATNRDCPGNAVCVPSPDPTKAVCMSPTSAPLCIYDSDCPTNLRCSSRGMCTPQCNTDRDCIAYGGVNAAACLEHECIVASFPRGRCTVLADCVGYGPTAFCSPDDLRCFVPASGVPVGDGGLDGAAPDGARNDAGASANEAAVDARGDATGDVTNDAITDAAATSADASDGCSGAVCDGGCANLANDPRNCGACGNACGTGVGCMGGHCGCGAGFATCGGVCADLFADQSNCGSCGHACPASQVCSDGACRCAEGTALCNGACVDVTSDQANCGACGHACPAVQACLAGVCRCAGGGTLCNGACVDATNDQSNCGGCGHVCAAAQSCRAGTCACANTGEQLCGTSCVNVLASSANCGGCNAACTATQVCANGTCGCAAGQFDCSGTCVNRSTDARNCGTCGTVCPTGTTCAGGSCTCATGFSVCGTACVNRMTDAANCGTCANACTGGQSCNAGACGNPDTLSQETAGPLTGTAGGLVQSPITVRLVRSDTSAPVSGATIAITAPAGGSADATVTTDSTGRASFQPYLSRTPGTQTFTLTTPGAVSITVTVTATAPPSGATTTVLNATSMPGASSTFPAAATGVAIRNPRGMALASDGTLYVTDTGNHRVLSISPGGIANLVAGTTGTSGSAGDGGMANVAQFSSPTGLALDASNTHLYIADTNNNRVRVVDLASGVISTLAGNGTSGTCPFGDNGLGTSANLSQPTALATAPGGALYVIDAGHQLVRRVTLASGVISTALSGSSSGCNPGSTSLYCTATAATDCGLAVSPSGGVFVTSASQYQTAARIVRIEGGNAVTVSSGGVSTADHVGVESAQFPCAPQLGFDAGGNLYAAVPCEQRVRRIDVSTATTTLVGMLNQQGIAADGQTVSQLRLNTPLGVLVDAQRGMYVLDYGNNAVRYIAGVASSTARNGTVVRVAGDGQNAVITQIAATPLQARANDADGNAIAYVSVAWASTDGGAAVYTRTGTTDVAGSATTRVRPGMRPQAYVFRATLGDLYGRANATADFTVTGTAPSAGTVLTLFNADRGTGTNNLPGSSTRATLGQLTGLAVVSDGTMYVGSSDQCAVAMIGPTGSASIFAGLGGGNPNCGNGADGYAANAAMVGNVGGVAYDTTSQRAYFASNWQGEGQVRYVDTSAGNTLQTLAGGGSSVPPGSGTSAFGTLVALSPIGSMVAGPSGLYFGLTRRHNGTAEDRGFFRADPSTGLLWTWLHNSTSYYCPTQGTTSPFYTVTEDGFAQGGLAFDATGRAYISSGYCNASNNPTNAIGYSNVAAPAVPTSIAVIAGFGTSTSEGEAAATTQLNTAPSLALDANGLLVYADYTASRIRRVSGTGNVTTVIGNGTDASASDLSVAGPTVPVSSPYTVAAYPGGHLVYTEREPGTVRMIW